MVLLLEITRSCFSHIKIIFCTWCGGWGIRDQLDVTSYYALFNFFYAQHVSDINTSIIRSLRLFYWTTTLGACSCFDVCWSFGVAGLRWYQCGRPATRMVPCTIRTVHMTYAVTLKITTHPNTRCRKPYAATQHLMFLMMGVCTRNMSSQEYINKIT